MSFITIIEILSLVAIPSAFVIRSLPSSLQVRIEEIYP